MTEKIRLYNSPIIHDRYFNQFVNKLGNEIKLSIIQCLEGHLVPGREMQRVDRISECVLSHYKTQLKRKKSLKVEMFRDSFLSNDMKNNLVVYKRNLKGRVSIISALDRSNRARVKKRYIAEYEFAKTIFDRPYFRYSANLMAAALDEVIESRNDIVFTKLYFRVHDVHCKDLTNPEISSDEIKLGFIAINHDGTSQRINYKKIGTFDEGDTLTVNKNILFDLAGGPDTFPKGYAVYVCLAEADGGGFGKFLSDLYDAVQSYVIEILAATGALVGAEVGAAIGSFGGPIGALVGAVVGAILGLVVGFIVNALEDDIFRPQLAAVALSSATALFGESNRSYTKYLTFKDHGGEYRINYHWELQI